MADEIGAETSAPATVADAYPSDLVGAPVEEVAEGGTEATSESAPQTYRVTVDGEEIEVSLEEALQGYQRQADYTRKTQELASQREELNQAARLVAALDADPERAVQVLAQAYGVSLGEAQQMVDDAEDEALDPEEARWQTVESFIEAQQEREAQQMLDAKLEELRTKFGDYDEEQFIEFALNSEIKDLDKAFGAFAFERIVNKGKDRTAADQEIEDKKRTAAPVAGGHGVVAGSTSGQPAPINSVRGAFDAALLEHDVTL